jgi:hypothetical protein
MVGRAQPVPKLAEHARRENDCYNGSPIAIHRKLDAERLFPQEKSTLHAAWENPKVQEPKRAVASICNIRIEQ